MQAPFHKAFAPFAVCVGPAHSNVHPDHQGLLQPLRAETPFHSTAVRRGTRLSSCGFSTRLTEQMCLLRCNGPSLVAAHADVRAKDPTRPPAHPPTCPPCLLRCNGPSRKAAHACCCWMCERSREKSRTASLAPCARSEVGSEGKEHWERV
eukprot:351869-Chlamydomonas_euryale.AAC.1